jgi:hypothetical protein
MLIGVKRVERRVNFLQQRLASHWFVQETGGSGFHHQIAKVPIAVGSDKNDWDVVMRIEQPPLQFDAAHSWQAHVKN